MDDFLRGSTPLLNRVIFDFSLPVGVILTYARLVALAYRNQYRYTDWLDFAGQLVPMMGVKKTQLREHLRWLQVARLVNWSIDERHRYRIFILQTGNALSGMPEPVVEGIDSFLEIKNQENQKQQQPETANPVGDQGTGERAIRDQGIRDQAVPGMGGGGQSAQAHGASFHPSGLPAGGEAGLSPLLVELWSLQGDPVFVETMSWLSQAGVWTDHALHIARQIAANERQPNEYLPTRADVLGWMAYCFALKQKYKVEKPAQVLAANLRANRRCPLDLLPPRVCRVCGYEEGWCRCAGEADYVFPPDFLDLALEIDGALYHRNWWAICEDCHNLTCQCDDVDEDQDA